MEGKRARPASSAPASASWESNTPHEKPCKRSTRASNQLACSKWNPFCSPWCRQNVGQVKSQSLRSPAQCAAVSCTPWVMAWKLIAAKGQLQGALLYMLQRWRCHATASTVANMRMVVPCLAHDPARARAALMLQMRQCSLKVLAYFCQAGG